MSKLYSLTSEVAAYLPLICCVQLSGVQSCVAMSDVAFGRLRAIMNHRLRG